MHWSECIHKAHPKSVFSEYFHHPQKEAPATPSVVPSQPASRSLRRALSALWVGLCWTCRLNAVMPYVDLCVWLPSRSVCFQGAPCCGRTSAPSLFMTERCSTARADPAWFISGRPFRLPWLLGITPPWTSTYKCWREHVSRWVCA